VETSGTVGSRWRAIRRSLARARLARAGAVILVGVVLAAALASWIAPYGPEEGDLGDRLLPPAWTAQGDPRFLLGTDSFGRDVLTRVVFGTRVSLLVAGAAVLGGGVLGVALGTAAGFYGGRLDDVVMRVAEVQLAFPFVLLAISLLTVLGPGMGNLILVLTLGSWVTFARLTRGQALALRDREFVQAARALGARDPRIIARAILPNLVAAVIVVASFSLAELVIAQAALSFLGLGLPPTVPTWGGMLAEGREYVLQAWWMGTFPGLAIMATVLAINALGDWTRDYLDPRVGD
jgi:peptide/nickel transport system permease protein